MAREIVVDTETTGLDLKAGDRLVEVGCVEIVNRIPTGREFHSFINPERDVTSDALSVHGLTTAFLTHQPLFRDVAMPLLEFIGEANLVIHNAAFDLGFLNAELGRLGHTLIASERVVDTLSLARRRHPAGPNSLDALCKRYGIDATARSKHGALLDAHLLAQVYVELLGERQARLALPMLTRGPARGVPRLGGARPRPHPLPPRLSPAEERAHGDFIATLGPNALWVRPSEDVEGTVKVAGLG
jgi:DNA polymerase-3 subunit epsilon